MYIVGIATYNVTFPHLTSKEVAIHKPCVPHSRDITKCTPVSVHSDVARGSGAHQTSTAL